MLLNKVNLFAATDVLSFWRSENVVQFSNELLDCRNELDKTFRDKYCTIVVTLFSTLGHSLGDVSNNVVERHSLSLYFLAHEADVWLALQSTFESNVACRATHQLDEVPVLASRVAVALDVTDEF